jgi:hypothetical protein
MSIESLQKKARGMENVGKMDFVGKKEDFLNRIYFKEMKQSDFFDRMPRGSKSMTGSGFEKMVGGAKKTQGGFDKYMEKMKFGVKHSESNVKNVTDKIGLFSMGAQKTAGNRTFFNKQPGKFKGKNQVVQSNRILQFLPNRTINNVKQGKKPVVSNLGLNVTGPMLTPDKLSKNFQFGEFSPIKSKTGYDQSEHTRQKIELFAGGIGNNWANALHSDTRSRNAEMYNPDIGEFTPTDDTAEKKSEFVASAKAAGKEIGEAVGGLFKKPTYYGGNKVEELKTDKEPIIVETYTNTPKREYTQPKVESVEEAKKPSEFWGKAGGAAKTAWSNVRGIKPEVEAQRIYNKAAQEEFARVSSKPGATAAEIKIALEALKPTTTVSKPGETETTPTGKEKVVTAKDRAATLKYLADLEERFNNQRATNKLLKPLVQGSQDMKLGFGVAVPGGFESFYNKATMLSGRNQMTSRGVMFGTMDVNRTPFASKVAGMMGRGPMGALPMQGSKAGMLYRAPQMQPYSAPEMTPQSPMPMGGDFRDSMPTKEQIEAQGLQISPRSGRAVTYVRGPYKKDKKEYSSSTQNV